MIREVSNGSIICLACDLRVECSFGVKSEEDMERVSFHKMSSLKKSRKLW